MSNQAALLAVETAQLIVAVDTTRGASDPYKLPAALATLVGIRRTALEAAISAAALAEGDRAGASLTCRDCLTRLEDLHRVGFRYLAGLLPDSVEAIFNGPHISDAVRLQVKEYYGFTSGEVGDFTDDRREEMGRLAPLAAGQTVANPAWHYPEDLVSAIGSAYITLNAFQGLATGGSRQVAVQAVEERMGEMQDAIARVRGIYIAGSDLGDRTPELARIGLQPRRLAGEASSGLLPDAPAAPVFDSMAKTLSVPALPANCSSMRAYRQKPGGPRELAGVSLTPVVSLIMAGPLEPGVTYETWLAGVLENREGPESPRVPVLV